MSTPSPADSGAAIDADLPIRVTALYRFTPFPDPEAVRGPLALACCSQGVKGTLLLAHEGINGTIAGTDEAIDRVLAHIRALPGCADLDVRESRALTMPFHRMKVRIKREIVTMGQPDIDPLADVGHYVAPADWNALIDRPDTILIDTRNDYEVAIGTFQGAIDPETRTFRDFPDWFRARRDELLANGRAAPKIAMFCTGGIRCEKATAFVKAEGLDEVYHLKGGILAYLEQIPEEQSRWEGECFVFDQRVAVGHGMTLGTHELCHACMHPIRPEDRASPLYAEGVSCPACHADRTDEQRAGYAERHRQTKLAMARGAEHVGSTHPPKRG
ncbi:rhodanese-related sulfurtransferase [Sphingomonas sp. AP4-R1]|uniref:oxygen-dependent tRNA uridine(34) hydroxylase TrhO n=1 Tax=Sphingomonas sp. AP4-R1 TaxID=2735134 RepID=UPI00149394BC|nr:rhodanese-related sulfurtransferase [Sphingomonas sp. AP4-R1]QJU57734.1 rhodanese-related sulfurtransferase [Sphingomonas sp. AP4-R1]